jgi:phosphatidate cytidylyltransferase
MPDNPHLKRILTGLTLIIPPAAAIIFRGWVLATVLVVVVALALWEFYSLFAEQKATRMDLRLKIGCMGLGALLLAACASKRSEFILLALLFSFWAVAMHLLFDYSRNPENFEIQPGLTALMGLLYLPLCLQCFLWMQPLAMVLVLAATAVSDTAAFYTGHLVGGAKVWTTVSPKKTWAGSFGGCAACVALTVVFGLLLGQAPWWAWCVLGLAMNLAAQFGDFFESVLKRSLGVKDSGRLLPGHGGILDRIDGLLFALPVYLLAESIYPFFGVGGATP